MRALIGINLNFGDYPIDLVVRKSDRKTERMRGRKKYREAKRFCTLSVPLGNFNVDIVLA